MTMQITPNKDRAFINNLSKNKNIVILKQDKAIAIILNGSKYIKNVFSS